MRLRLTLTAVAAATLASSPALATSCIAPQDLSEAERARLIEDAAFGAVAFRGVVEQPLNMNKARGERLRVTENILGAVRPTYNIWREFGRAGGRVSMTITSGDEQYDSAGAEVYELLTPRLHMPSRSPVAYSWLRTAFDNLERLMRFSILSSGRDVPMAQNLCMKLLLRDDPELLRRTKERAREIGR